MFPEANPIQPQYPNEVLTALVERVFVIEEIMWGEAKRNYLARFRGRLRLDSEAAYEQLAGSLRQYGITPLFRSEGDTQWIVLAPFVVQAKPSNPWVNAVMFGLTLISVLLAGAIYVYDGPVIADPVAQTLELFARLASGVPFALAMLSILLAHEFGHYLAARYHKTHVTLPYFIPFPFSAFGTMGAFIQLKEPPKNRNVLLDIGLAGPLAGLAVAIPVLFLGLWLSELGELPTQLPPGSGLTLEGNSLLYLASKFVVFGQLLPAPESYGGLPPLLYWLRYFFTGQPLPLGGVDVLLHPVAWAGWAGLLVTALNLIPAGQLDGGHLLYVLLGKRARNLLPVILVSLVILGFFWSGWWLWAVIISFLGRAHAEPLDQITPLTEARRGLAILGLAIFLLVFSPIPLTLVGG